MRKKIITPCALPVTERKQISMSAFDDTHTNRNSIKINLTAEQRKELDMVKGILGIPDDSSAVKQALANLSRSANLTDKRYCRCDGPPHVYSPDWCKNPIFVTG